MSEKARKPLYLWSVLTNRCPRCREGKIYVTENAYDLKNNMKMHEKCPVCGQPTELEVGFYYGTSYVSYALTVAYSVATFFAWWVLLGFSLYDNSIIYWLIFNGVTLILLQQVFMRLSRSLWLSWFVKYDPDWKTKQAKDYERIVKEHMNNW
jgi:uncharacterized protein (DUF983 family)